MRLVAAADARAPSEPPLDFPLQVPMIRDMRHVPTWLKVVAALSVLAEATAAALVFWHTGPKTR